MLHASETWPLTKPNLQRLQRNDRAMVRQICNIRLQDIVTTRSSELLVQLGIEDLDLILKERRLRWYGHVKRSNGAVKTAFDIKVDGERGPGRPKMTCTQLTERDCREWKLSAINPHDKHTWRSGVRSAIRAASQLSGRGLTGVDVAPVLHVNKKSDYDIYDLKNLSQYWTVIGPMGILSVQYRFKQNANRVVLIFQWVTTFLDRKLPT